MQQPDPSPASGGARRRGLFSGRGAGAEVVAPGARDEAERAQELMSAYHARVERRLEEGLSAIQETANSLMHEIASEVWRTAGGDKDEVRSQILLELSRDQALRSLIAHADERFQALSLRTGRLEDTLNMVAESVRSAKDQLAESVGSLGDVGGTAGMDASALRAQLAEVTRQVAAALGTLAERDQAIVDTVRERIIEHGEVMTRETTRISAAMESYVQHGVEAIGQLAGNLEGQIQTITGRDDEITERFRRATDEHMAMLGEQLQLMYERMAIDKGSLATSILEIAERTEDRSRAVGEYLDLVNERVDLAARDAVAQMNRTLEMRLMSLAKLVRSDAEALRAALVRTAEDQDERLARTLDERLARVADGAAVATTRMLEEVTSRFEALGRAAGDRAAQAADVAIAERFDDVVARLQAASTSLERSGTDIRSGRELVQESLSRTVDQGVSALARLIRADNETLAQQIVADQEASKQALRAMKELQANLPTEVIDMVEQRFASLAESIERSNEMLAKRIDRMAERIGEQHDTDIQVVIDRMGDAMHALASLGRPRSAQQDQGPMIELG